MRAYTILPVAAIQSASLSKDAQRRLLWIDWYFSHWNNAEGTCRHFGIAKSVFYRWFHRFDPKNLQSLEFDTKTRRPKHVRQTTISQDVQKRIYDIRSKDIEKSKYEIQEELKRDGVAAGTIRNTKLH